MRGKRSSPAPDSIRLSWSCPLLLPWQVREGWVASSGRAMATRLGEGSEGGRSWHPETPGRKGDLLVIFCLFHLTPDCCRQRALFVPFPKHIWVCSWPGRLQTTGQSSSGQPPWQMTEATKPLARKDRGSPDSLCLAEIQGDLGRLPSQHDSCDSHQEPCYRSQWVRNLSPLGPQLPATREPKPFCHIRLASKVLRENSVPSGWRLMGRYQTSPSCMESTTVIHIPANALPEGSDPD